MIQVFARRQFLMDWQIEYMDLFVRSWRSRICNSFWNQFSGLVVTEVLRFEMRGGV
jgi:hypothetical protein